MYSRQVRFQLDSVPTFPVLLGKASFIPAKFKKKDKSLAASGGKSMVGKTELNLLYGMLSLFSLLV